MKPGTVITAKETATVDGFVLDGTPKSIEIKEGEAQTLTFYNTPVGGLELIKVSESDKSQRIKGVTFEIREMDGGLVPDLQPVFFLNKIILEKVPELLKTIRSAAGRT